VCYTDTEAVPNQHQVAQPIRSREQGTFNASEQGQWSAVLPKKFLHRYDKGTFCRTHLPQLRIVPLPDPDANINAHHGLSTKTRSPLLWRQRTNPGLDALQVFMFRDLRRQKSMPPT